MKRLAFLVSGSGTNLQAVMDACNRGEINGKVDVVISTSPYAYALVRAESAHIPNFTYELSAFKTKEDRDAEILRTLQRFNIDYVILTGFLSIVPRSIINEYAGRIITLHASLLPKYGGKGFYGERIHKAVLAMRETESGCTAFFVTPEVDAGPIIEQRRIRVNRGDTPDSLQKRILAELEHPMIVEIVKDLCDDRIHISDGVVVRE